MYQKITISPGVPQEYSEASDFVRVLNAPDDTQIIFYAAGREVGSVKNIGGGYAEKFGQMFDRIVISTATGGTVEFVLRLGNDVRYDKPPTGTTTVTNLDPRKGAMNQAAATVTSASAQLLPAKANRLFLLIQNNHISASIFVNVAGATATLAAGLKIGPGGSLILDEYSPTGAIFAIGDIASNTAIVVIEG